MTLTTEDGLSNNSVKHMANDADGRLWIGTWDGLNVYDGNNFTVYKHEKGNDKTIPANDIEEVHMDPEGTMWVLTEQYQLAMYQGGGEFKTLKLEAPIREGYFVKDSFPIVGLSSGQYLRVSKNGSEPVLENDLPQVQNHEKYFEILKRKVPDAEISSFLKDSRGNLWFAERFRGLYMVPNEPNNIRNERIEHYEHDSYNSYSFSSNEIDDIYEDIFGHIWLAHKDGGLSKVYKGSEGIKGFYPHPKKYAHLPNEAIRAITKDRTSELWLGYYTQGLYYFDINVGCFVEFPLDKADDDSNWKRIRSLYTDSEGGIWAGTYAGLIHILNDRTTYYSPKKYKGLPNNRNYSMIEDNDQNLWIGCWGGLAKFDLKEKTFQSFEGQDVLNDYHVRKISISKEVLIIATENNGVLFFSPEKGGITMRLTEKNGLLGNSCYSLAQDKATGDLWIGSLGGITVINPITNTILASITEENGLPSHMVYSLHIENGKVWAGTTKGLVSIDMKKFSLYAFNLSEGWRNTEFSEGASFQDDKGILYYGGINGLDYFSPQKMYFTSQLPILKVTVDGSSDTSLIEKKHKENDLEVQINPISYSSNPNNDVQYQLEGYDDNWIQFKENPIVYKKIPFGEYLLKVRNSLSQEAENIEIPIVVDKPYYLKWWFITLIIGGIVILVITYIFFRNLESRKYQFQLERKIEERTAQIKSQKNALESVNRNLDLKNRYVEEQKEELVKLHNALKSSDFEIDKFKSFVLSDFKAPLNKIMHMSALIKEHDLGSEIKEESGKLANLISEWEYLSDAKHFATMEPTAYKLNDLIVPIIDYLEFQAQKIDIGLYLSANVPDIWIKINVLGFRFGFKYLFNDILKYSEKGSKLQISFNKKENDLSVEILSNSMLLSSDFPLAIKFSPYYKAVEVFLLYLKGTIKTSFSDQSIISIKVPLQPISTEALVGYQIRLEHLDAPDLDNKKNLVYVLCNNLEKIFISKLLENDECYLKYEHSTGAMLSALKSLKVEALVVYSNTVSDDLIRFIKQLKSIKKTKGIPIVFISESIDHFMQEEMLTLGVDYFIQFPISKELIQKKLGKLLEFQRKALQQEKQNQLGYENTENANFNVNEKLAQKALQLIKANLKDAAFNVDKMNMLLGITKIKGYRLFKEVFGKSPHMVLFNLRMQQAEYLLKNTNLNISEIGYESGYNNPRYFSKQFKKFFGKNPKKYRSMANENQL